MYFNNTTSRDVRQHFLRVLQTMACLLMCLGLGQQQSQAGTFTVKNTNDVPGGGAGHTNSLRWAIEQVNMGGGPHLIDFDMGAPGTYVITLNANLPDIDYTVTIDGLSDPGSHIVIDGNNNQYQTIGVHESATACQFIGLEIRNGFVDGITIQADRALIEQCHIHHMKSHNTPGTGTHYGWWGAGIILVSSNSTIRACTLEYNDGPGIMIYSWIIGTVIDKRNTGGNVMEDNVIRHNMLDPGLSFQPWGGITMHESLPGTSSNNPTNENSWCDHNRMSRNLIYDNTSKYGIELHNGANSPNHSPLDDVWEAAITPPTITPSPSFITTDVVHVEGTADPGAGHVVEVFEGDGTSKNAFRYLGSTTTDAGGNWEICLSGATGVSHLVATITDLVGNTSELSQAEATDASNLLTAAFHWSFDQPGCINDAYHFTSNSLVPLPGATYYWEFSDPASGGNNSSTQENPSHTFIGTGPSETPQSFLVTLTVTVSCGGSVMTSTATNTITVCGGLEACCETAVPAGTVDAENPLSSNGQFYFDPTTGTILFKRHDCPAEYAVDCFQANRELPDMSKVVSATAVTLTDDWKDVDDEPFEHLTRYPTSNVEYSVGLNNFESNNYGNWRVNAEYTYRDALDKDPDQEYNFNKGTFELVPFSWKNQALNDGHYWVNTNTINKYTRNGQPSEDNNIIDVFSSSKFGYNNTLPILVAQNAEGNSVAFHSFENSYRMTFASAGLDITMGDDQLYDLHVHGTRTDEHAHTGKYSVRMKAESNPGAAFYLGQLKLPNEATVTTKYMVRAWVRIDKSKPDLPEGALTVRTNGTLAPYSWATSTNMVKVSDAGEWTLYEAILSDGTVYAGSVDLSKHFGLSFDMTGYEEGDIYLDDVRIQPLQSEMVCYVYDEAQRIVASFDDQHFASLFQYNMEGELIRKRKETVEGVKTISEAHYNAKGEQRQSN